MLSAHQNHLQNLRVIQATDLNVRRDALQIKDWARQQNPIKGLFQDPPPKMIHSIRTQFEKSA
jgi:hypothetical protein